MNKPLAYDPYMDASIAHSLGVELIGLDELLGKADFVSICQEVLASDDLMLKWMTYDVLGRLGEAAAPAARDLAEALMPYNPSVSSRVLKSLERIGPAAKAAIPHLQAALNSGERPDAERIREVIRVIGANEFTTRAGADPT